MPKQVEDKMEPLTKRVVFEKEQVCITICLASSSLSKINLNIYLRDICNSNLNIWIYNALSILHVQTGTYKNRYFVSPCVS